MFKMQKRVDSNMKCPECGSPKCEYVESRHKNWKGETGAASKNSSMEPRKDFKVLCKKCGYTGTIKPYSP